MRNEFDVTKLTIEPSEAQVFYIDYARDKYRVCDRSDNYYHFHGEVRFNTLNAYDKLKEALGIDGKDLFGRDPSRISKIYHNPKKHTTVVVFDYTPRSLFGDICERKVKVKLDENDPDNIYMAVASAVSIYKYGTNSQFKAHIRKSVDTDIYGAASEDLYLIAAQFEASSIFGSWKEFKKVVDEKLHISEKKEVKK